MKEQMHAHGLGLCSIQGLCVDGGIWCEQAGTLMQLRGCQLQDAGQGVGRTAGRLRRLARLVHDHQLQAQHPRHERLLPDSALCP